MKSCALCQQSVFPAETTHAFGKLWHNSCFVCSAEKCGKLLDSLTACEHRQTLYCHQCYNRTVGGLRSYHGLRPTVTHISSSDEAAYSYKVYDEKWVLQRAHARHECPNSYAVSKPSEKKASKLDNPSSVQKAIAAVQKDPSLVQNNKCPKCEKVVYEAEKIKAAGQVWHKNTCFTCTVCAKSLESRSLCERKGQLFCNVCYGKQFGPRMYGHGSAFVNVL
uniref:Cysteine-rich protein 1 n=1 Tax=Steinernema glaseri TaxID=37863 RepID=A0A1I8AU48_9BILA